MNTIAAIATIASMLSPPLPVADQYAPPYPPPPEYGYGAPVQPVPVPVPVPVVPQVVPVPVPYAYGPVPYYRSPVTSGVNLT